MKLTAILLISACLTASAKGHGQNVTLNVKDAPLQKVFAAIETQTGYSFVFYKEQLQEAKSISVDVKNESLETVLQLVFKDQPLTYTLRNKFIVVKQKPAGIPDDVATIENIPPPIDIRGRVVDSLGNALSGATVQVKGSNIKTQTDRDGFFELRGVSDNATLQISYVGYNTLELKASNSEGLSMVTLKLNTKALSTVTIKGNTGYGVIDRNHPGSFDVIDNKLLNRRVGTNILERIENLTPGLSYNTPGETTSGNPGAILIRGRNSIFSNVAPLLVVDNFPYDGNIDNINPNDIESITILKDAASASRWGARAGNGVIVITTKRGTSSKPQIRINSNVTYIGKPDLRKLPRVSTDDYIELEKWLFPQGYYNSEINNTVLRPPLTPVVELLLQQRNGTISSTEADSKINAFKGTNVIDDLEEYFYQPSISQRHSMNVSGNTPFVNYYMSAGFDRSTSPYTRGVNSSRITLLNQNTFKVSRKLEIETGINYTQMNGSGGFNSGISDINSGGNGPKQLYPYADLVDNNGQALVLVKDMRSQYKDTMGGGKILDWRYKPYDELNHTDYTSRGRDFLWNIGFRYKFDNYLKLEVRYRYQNGLREVNKLAKQEAYTTRDLINKFYQPNATTKFPVPIGGILDFNNSEFRSHQGRIQINYIRTFKDKHDVVFNSGWEIKDLQTTGSSYKFYGYTKQGNKVNSGLDFVTQFPQFNYGSFSSIRRERISNIQSVSSSLDRFLSLFGDLSYTFDNRYTFTSSVREDAANLFGVTANQKGTPLWSVGGAWQINNEKFYTISWLRQLRLRMSYGYSGNFSRQTPAVSVVSFPNQPNYMGLSYAEILNPPNNELRWERNKIINVGIDFNSKKGRVSGSVEYYNKKNIDLMAQSPIDPTTGVIPPNTGIGYVYRNVASMKGHGLEVTLNTKNIDRQFKWGTTFLYSSTFSKVYEYFLPQPTTVSSYVGIAGTGAIEIGKPLNRVYAYQWAGLDPVNGDPMGYLGKDISKDYNAIFTQTKLDSLVYYGVPTPSHFGAIRNDFNWNNLSISVNISYKLGYSFLRESINYRNLYTTWMGHSDYSKRWQQPGDEIRTDVPSRVYVNYPQFSNRETFYRDAALVEKGGHISLDDISISYAISKSNFPKLPFREISLYSYLSNIRLLIWKANDAGLDPSNPQGNINPVNISFGLNIGL